MDSVDKRISVTLLVLASTLVGLLFAEIILQLFIPPIRIDDDILGHKAGPGLLDRDEHGFRNERALGRAHIVAIGDSQTEGLNSNLTDAWPQILEKLASNTVYQMALGGYGSVQYSYLFDKALQLNPKIIIIGLYMGNDLYDAYKVAYSIPYWKHLQVGTSIPPTVRKDENDILSKEVGLALGHGIKIGSFHWYVLKIHIWMREHSKLYTLVEKTAGSLGMRFGIAGKHDGQEKDIKKFAQNNPEMLFIYDAEPNIQTVMSPKYRLVAVDLSDWRTNEGLRITELLLEDMQNKAAQAEVLIVVAIIPTKEAVYGAYLEEKGTRLSVHLQYIVQKERQVANRITSFCDEIGVSCMQVLNALRDQLFEGQKVYPDSMDGHPTAVGYATIAEAIYAHINSEHMPIIPNGRQ